MLLNQLQSKHLLQSQRQKAKQKQKVKLKPKAKQVPVLLRIQSMKKKEKLLARPCALQLCRWMTTIKQVLFMVTLWDCSRWNSQASPACKTRRIVKKKYKKLC